MLLRGRNCGVKHHTASHGAVGKAKATRFTHAVMFQFK